MYMILKLRKRILLGWRAWRTRRSKVAQKGNTIISNEFQIQGSGNVIQINGVGASSVTPTPVQKQASWWGTLFRWFTGVVGIASALRALAELFWGV